MKQLDSCVKKLVLLHQDIIYEYATFVDQFRNIVWRRQENPLCPQLLYLIKSSFKRMYAQGRKLQMACLAVATNRESALQW